MKQEQIEQIVAATDNLIAQSISDAVAEQFKKRNKPTVNNNLIIVIAVAILAVAGMWFMTNSINKNSDANAMTVVSAITPIADGQAGIYDAIDGVAAKVDTVNVGLDEIDTRINQLQGQTDIVMQQNGKIIQKVESLSYLISKANAKKLADYQKCLMGQTGKMEDAIKACKDKLK